MNECSLGGWINLPRNARGGERRRNRRPRWPHRLSSRVVFFANVSLARMVLARMEFHLTSSREGAYTSKRYHRCFHPPVENVAYQLSAYPSLILSLSSSRLNFCRNLYVYISPLSLMRSRFPFGPADIALPNFWKGRDGSYYRVDFRGIKGEAAIYTTHDTDALFTAPRLSFPWNSIRLVKTLQLQPLKLFNRIALPNFYSTNFSSKENYRRSLLLNSVENMLLSFTRKRFFHTWKSSFVF